MLPLLLRLLRRDMHFGEAHKQSESGEWVCERILPLSAESTLFCTNRKETLGGL